MTAPEAKTTIASLLSLNAGYVDTAGYLALQGLFTAHVTGNFVTLGASLALGTSGAIAKLLALPMFCVGVIGTRLLDTLLSGRRAVLRRSSLFKFYSWSSAAHLRFHDTDSWRAVLAGMVLVGAMAIQNALHRVHLGSTPPSTIMTGTTTQVMIDLADRIHGPNATDDASSSRLAQMSRAMVFFVIGCGAADQDPTACLSALKCITAPRRISFVKGNRGFVQDARRVCAHTSFSKLCRCDRQHHLTLPHSREADHEVSSLFV